MVQEAAENNPSEDIRFFLTDGAGKLDFPDETFDACFTVNTLYFWKDVILQLAEIDLRKQQQVPFQVFHFSYHHYHVRVVPVIGVKQGFQHHLLIS